MKLATFTHEGATRIGIVRGDDIIDLSVAAPSLPTDMLAFIEEGDGALATARSVEAGSAGVIALVDVKLETPIARPPSYVIAGLNYHDHVAESKQQTPVWMSFAAKPFTCIVGPTDSITMPRVSDELDYEIELGVVIGKGGRHIPSEKAEEAIFGYVVVNDGSVRDWQFRGISVHMGKSFDGTSPIGPWIVTRDEIEDPQNLQLRTWVNDELRQNENTSNMIFSTFEHIAYLSTASTLLPGTIMTTGTPSGVGLSLDPDKPGNYLKVGDRVRMEIEKIGVIENEVVAEGG